MNKQYVLNDTASSNQRNVILASVSVSCFFFLFLDWEYIMMGIMPMFFYIPLNIFMKRFSEVYTDGHTFFVKNLYQKEQRIDASLFDKILDMTSMVRYPDSPYYTIYFKNGMKFHFEKKRDSLQASPMKNKGELAKELTREVKDFLQIALEN